MLNYRGKNSMTKEGSEANSLGSKGSRLQNPPGLATAYSLSVLTFFFIEICCVCVTMETSNREHHSHHVHSKKKKKKPFQLKFLNSTVCMARNGRGEMAQYVTARQICSDHQVWLYWLISYRPAHVAETTSHLGTVMHINHQNHIEENFFWRTSSLKDLQNVPTSSFNVFRERLRHIKALWHTVCGCYRYC